MARASSKTTPSTHVLVNKTTTNVSLEGGRISIPAGGWVHVTSKDIESDHVVQAARRGWIHIQHSEPGTPASPEKTPVEIVQSPNAGSTTFPADHVKPKQVERAETVPANPQAAPTTSSTGATAPAVPEPVLGAKRAEFVAKRKAEDKARTKAPEATAPVTETTTASAETTATPAETTTATAE